MFTGAAHAGARQERSMLADGQRTISNRVAERDGLLRDVLHHLHANAVIELVHAVDIIARLAQTAAFEHDHRQPGSGRQFLRHEEPEPPAAYDYRVRFAK